MTLPLEDDLTAAEYVLGTLDLGARAQAEARIAREPGFAGAVARWAARLEPLNEDYAPLPAPDLLPKIEARLFPQAAPRPYAALRGVMGWLTAGLATAAVAGWIFLHPLPRFEAVLQAETGLEYDARYASGQLVIERVAGAAAESGRDHELWLILGEAAPVSLGLLGETTRIAMADLPEGAVLAISLEPEGGSPTGAPTGPVLALGPLAKL
jgi:anti-sigma-K factor RskA